MKQAEQNHSGLNQNFSRAILLKVSFRPEAMFKTQAFLLYAALAGQVFTADIIPMELRQKDNGEKDTTTQGAAVSMLRRIDLIEMAGRVTSPAPSRNGAEVKLWRLGNGKRQAALAWLEAQGYMPPEEADGDLWTLVSKAEKAEKQDGWEYEVQS